MLIPVVQAQAPAGDTRPSLSPEQLEAGENVPGQELSINRTEQWDLNKWGSRHACMAAE